MPISRERCTHVAFDTPSSTEKEITELMAFVPDWEILNDENGSRLCRTFPFEDWPATIEFASRIAEQAAFENHHPVMILSMGRVTATWWTHEVYGLHRNDFIMACRTDHLFTDARLGSS